jgi:hypothetical protein
MGIRPNKLADEETVNQGPVQEATIAGWRVDQFFDLTCRVQIITTKLV